MLDERKRTVINYGKGTVNHMAISWSENFSDEHRSNPKLHVFFFFVAWCFVIGVENSTHIINL